MNFYAKQHQYSCGINLFSKTVVINSYYGQHELTHLPLAVNSC